MIRVAKQTGALWMATLMILSVTAVTGCTGLKGPVPEPVNPYNTRVVIDGVEKQAPTLGDIYPQAEAPIVKIIKGEVVDDATRQALLASPAETREPPEPMAGLSQKITSLILRGISIRQLTQILTELCGYNVLPTKTIEDLKINIFMQDTDLRTALETICRLNDLWYREGSNIITLMTRAEFIDDIEVRQKEHTRAFSIKYTNAADMAKLIQALMGHEVYLSRIEDEKVYGHIDPEEKTKISGEYQGPRLETSAQRIIFMNPAFEKSVNPAHAGTAEPESPAEPQDTTLSGLSAKSGEKPLLAILTVFRRNNSIIARSLDQGLLNEMAKIIEILDTPTSQVLLEVKILQITLGDEFESFFQFEYGNFGGNPVQSRIDPTQTVTEGFGISTMDGITPASSTAAGAVLSFNNIQARISLFESQGRATIISSPFLMSANNSKVDFFVGEEVPLRDDVKKETIPIGDSGNTLNTFIVDIKREELGTDIEMSSFINEDHTVTLEIKAEISSPMYSISSIGLSDDFGNVVNFPLDGVNKSKIKSILTARSGQTIALGGIIRETVDDGIKKVPILGDIPVLGFLFRQENRTKKKTETVIVLTPHIITHPGYAGAETRRFLDRQSSNPAVLEQRDTLLSDPAPGMTEEENK
ncbi:type II secretion system protein GspD [Desulfotignum balticum]|jgi:hypothetical protein|uniref:type II secretion system protein GspD n=1 Tax=Desulfotignum balticum TaxID=115781 RepID=UPI0003FEA18E|nr:hypothetical protein [Desulfotignum balticum]